MAERRARRIPGLSLVVLLFVVEPTAEPQGTERSAERSEVLGGAGGRVVDAPGAPLLTGLVADSRGRPLVGARVRAVPVGPLEQREATTGDDGRFVLPLPEDGPYRLRADLEGYESSSEIEDARTFGPRTHGVRLTLDPRPVTEFAVVDVEGKPVWRFALQIRSAPEECDAVAADLDLEPRSYPGGACAAFGRPGRDEVLIHADGHAPARCAVRPDEGSRTRQTVRLLPGSRLGGRVHRRGGDVEGLTVELERSTVRYLDAFSGRLRATTTDRDGRFTFTSLAAGDYRVAVTGPDVPRTVTRVDVAASSSTVLPPIVIPETGAIEGRVVVPEGRSAAAIVVELGGFFVLRPRVCVTDAWGRFAFAGLEPGVHELTVRAKRGVLDRAVPFDVGVTAGVNATPVLDLRPREPRPAVEDRDVEVRVRRAGEPAEGLHVVAYAADAPPWAPESDRAVTRRDGSATVTIPAQGRARIEVWTFRGLRLAERVVSATDGAHAEFDLEVSDLTVVLPRGTRVRATGTVWVAVGEHGTVELEGRFLDDDLRIDVGWVPAGAVDVRVWGDVLTMRRSLSIAAGEERVCVLTLADAE